MRFVISITYAATCIARISSMTGEDRTHEEIADEARDSIVRDANRTRSGALTDSALEGIADAYREACLRHSTSGLPGHYTCVARMKNDGTHTVVTMPGGYATLTRKGDLMAHIEILSDEQVAEKDAFIDGLMAGA